MPYRPKDDLPESVSSHLPPRTQDIYRETFDVPRDWARLIRKLRWIGLDDEAARLEWAVSNLPLEDRCELKLDPVDTD